MLPATRALTRQGAAGQCLPDVFEELASAGIHLRRSQMSMVVAGPGVGKSAIATIYAAHAGIGTLYFSADTDPHTMTCRLAASLTGATQDTIDEALRAGRGDEYLAAVDSLTNLQLSYDSSPSVDDICEEIDCYALVYGVYPDLIVVDNLMDVYADGDEFKGQKDVLATLNDLAREIGAHVMVLHHATGEYEDGDKPIPLSGVSNKLGKKPTLVLTMYRVKDEWTDALGVCPVKHRNGPADRTAKWVVWMKLDLARMRLGEQWSPSKHAV